MYSHVTVGTNDSKTARSFYDAVLGALGHEVPAADARAIYRGGDQAFGVTSPRNGEPATCANGGTVAFRANSPNDVDAFHAAGLANGGTDEGAPGVRPESNMYAAYLRDPDGNKICANTSNVSVSR